MGSPTLLAKNIFVRGKGPLVSVLLPTRGRPDGVCESVDSLYSLAEDKALIDFIFKIDSDDEETLKLCQRLEKIIPLKTLISPRGKGYSDMHLWVNDLSALATGDWLFLFNDDAKMVTPKWDQILLTLSAENPGSVADVCVLLAETKDMPDANAFMFVRKKVVEVMGHYSLNPYNDAWMYRVAKFAHIVCQPPEPIVVEHGAARPPSAVDIQCLSDIISTESIRQQMHDVDRLLTYMDRFERSYRG
jgi:hypothetical protein